MNYRHAFHAGNFADVMKHVVLVRILVHLLKKPSPFRVVDTHAGTGWFDLSGDEAGRTGEWRDGIGRLDDFFAPDVETLLAPYRAVIEGTRGWHGPQTYPGSPAIVEALLRREDRALFNELHPDDGALLAQRFGRMRGVKVLHLDGWTALHALIPPKEKRGLVLIDPPYEQPGEFERLGRELAKAVRKWPTGVYAAWYPIKDAGLVQDLAGSLAGAVPAEMLRLELFVARPSPGRLYGCGLVVVNPPWTLAGEAAVILPALADRMAGESGAFRCETIGGSDADGAARQGRAR